MQFPVGAVLLTGAGALIFAVPLIRLNKLPGQINEPFGFVPVNEGNEGNVGNAGVFEQEFNICCKGGLHGLTWFGRYQVRQNRQPAFFQLTVLLTVLPCFI